MVNYSCPFQPPRVKRAQIALFRVQSGSLFAAPWWFGSCSLSVSKRAEGNVFLKVRGESISSARRNVLF